MVVKLTLVKLGN